MSDLDNRERIHATDPGDMYRAIVGFPEQIRQAVEITQQANINLDLYRDINKIIVCGMGGSAIGGDLARTILADSLPYPMFICRNYNLPAFADEKTLVIGSSYSGNTEESLSAIEQAREKGCRLFGMTTGGKLGEICNDNNVPFVKLPPGLQPRAALGYSFVPLMLFFNQLKLSPFGPDDFNALADFMAARMDAFLAETPSDNNPAKQLAMQLYGRIPIIYSGPEVTDAVGTRIKGQICENAKMPAFANQFPEFNHNELVGWKVINAFRDFLRVVILRDDEDHPRVKARMDIVAKVIEKEEVAVIEVASEGANRLQRMMSLIQIGDFTSYYLAMLNNVDPSPVEVIDYLKDKLAEL